MTRWTNEPRLGKMPDRQLAKLLGVDFSSVFQARKRRGIPAFVQREAIDWDNEPLLGRMPDRQLADMLGVTVQAVQSARRTRGIARFRR